MINQIKLITLKNRFRPVKIDTVPLSIMFNGKKYEKPASISRKTWDGIINYMDINDDADFQLMLNNALNEAGYENE